MKMSKGFLTALILIFGLGIIDASAQQTTTKQTTTTTTRQTSSSRQQTTSSTSNNGRRRRVRRHKKVIKHVNYGRRTRGATRRTTTVRSGSTKVTVTKQNQ